MEKGLFTELQETTENAIERKKKPEYWDRLVNAMKDSAISGHYCLDIHGRLFNNKADLYDNQAEMLKDISENQILYSSNFRREHLKFEIETQINPLPADPLGDKEGYFKDIHVNIDWSGE